MKRHTLIVGGTRGVGRVLARMLSNDGHLVSVLGRSRLAEPAENNIESVAVDIQNDSALFPVLSELVEKKGKINNLIFLQRYKGTEDRWCGELEVGLNATHKIIEFMKDKFCTQAKIPGSIVMVSSIAGQFANDSQPLVYSLVKSGLNNMVLYYAASLGAIGIRVNAVSPITFVKEESKKYYFEENKKINELYQKIVPLGRMCTSEDVANVVFLLCSDKASFLSGQNIVVDGGLSIVSHEVLAKKISQV